MIVHSRHSNGPRGSLGRRRDEKARYCLLRMVESVHGPVLNSKRLLEAFWWLTLGANTVIILHLGMEGKLVEAGLLMVSVVCIRLAQLLLESLGS